MRYVTLISALLSSVLLSACVAEKPSAPQVAGNSGVGALITSARSGQVVPGPDPVDMATAANMFDSVCKETQPSLARAEKVVRSLPFTQDPKTGTYFHKKLDLSVKLVRDNGGACSMVFGSKEEPMVLALALAMSVSSNGEIGVDAANGASATKGPGNSEFTFLTVNRMRNRTYFHAVLSPRK
ncbi:MAG: hypothetical protein WBH14_13470 [Albidovulum sp.]